jgi:signal transduction histidine kinase/CheY-like chemotaxis protein
MGGSEGNRREREGAYAEELKSIRALSLKVNAECSMDELVACAMEEVLRVVKPDMVLFFVRDGDRLILRSKCPGTPGMAEALTPVHRVGECLCGLCVRDDEPKYSRNIHHDPRCTWDECRKSGFTSFAALPLGGRQRVIGVLGLAAYGERDFSLQRDFLETLANEISIAYHHCILVDDLTRYADELKTKNGELKKAERMRKESEKRLHGHQAMLQSVFNGIPDPLILLDHDLRVKMLNQAAAAYYRIDSVEGVKEKTCHALFKGLPEPCERCKVPAHIRNGLGGVYERNGLHDPDKIEKISIYPLKSAEGTEGGCVLHIHDITDEKRMEQELQQADKMISLGILVSGVAHEINNPNNFIMLNTRILEDSWKSVMPILDAHYEESGDFAMGGLPYLEMKEAVPKLLSGITGGTQRIMRIVEDLKDYARYQPGEVRAPLDVNQTLERAIALVSNQIRHSTSRFSVSYGEDLPMIQGDWQKIEQVIINLIQNACQALPDPGRALSVRSCLDRQAGLVAITVADEGTGIPKAILPRIMDPFFTTRRETGGVGLGLSVSSKIVRDHGGRLTVDSQEGKGTTFTVGLPVEQRRNKTRVLVVDDEAYLRSTVGRCLHKAGRYIVKEATNGVEACFMLGSETPDILILDINMPVMDGVEVCRQIRKTQSLKDVQVVVITGDRESRKARIISEMGYRILEKPFSAEELVEAVEAVFHQGVEPIHDAE